MEGGGRPGGCITLKGWIGLDWVGLRPGRKSRIAILAVVYSKSFFGDLMVAARAKTENLHPPGQAGFREETFIRGWPNLAPRRGAVPLRGLIRGCRCARPPATVWQPFGLEKPLQVAAKQQLAQVVYENAYWVGFTRIRLDRHDNKAALTRDAVTQIRRRHPRRARRRAPGGAAKQDVKEPRRTASLSPGGGVVPGREITPATVRHPP